MSETVPPGRELCIEVEDSVWAMPESTTNPEYVIPDVVLWHLVRRLNLDEPHKIGVDPMAGNGTPLGLINALGGCCFGIELRRDLSDIARTVLAQNTLSSSGWVIGQAPEVIHGDCTKVDLRRTNGQPLRASYIIASPPFRETLNGTLGDDIARAFDRILVPPGLLGFMLIDSADTALRDGVVVNPAAATVEYFERFGFKLLDKVAFWINNVPPGCDNQFTELMFVRQAELDYWSNFNPRPLSGR